MINVLEIGNSKVCYFKYPGVYTGEYYSYCLRLIVKALRSIEEPLNVIFGNINYDFNNSNRTLKTDIQFEHTLVKLGGRSVNEEVYGNTDLLGEDGKYLIRIDNYDYYNSLDGIFEYSVPNIRNIESNPRYSDYLNKVVYVAPTIYDNIDFESGSRQDTITMFSSNPSDRRYRVSSIAKNIQGVFAKEQLKAVYDRTKIMINVHQTDHHHTFEELRVLPALCNGVLVISENAPLTHTIPYADVIMWSSYGNLFYCLESVKKDYDYLHSILFTEELKNRLQDLQIQNYENIKYLLSK